MLRISWTRFWSSFVIGFIVTSQLNWAVAEMILNPWAMPAFEGFMRNIDQTSGLEIVKMVFGFMLPVLVVSVLLAMMDRPAGWLARALLVGSLVSLCSFFGVYTFLSGWGNVLWFPLMVTALCDTVTLLIGAVLIGFIQRSASTESAASL